MLEHLLFKNSGILEDLKFQKHVATCHTVNDVHVRRSHHFEKIQCGLAIAFAEFASERFFF